MDAEKIWGIVRTVVAAVAGGWAAKQGFNLEAVLGAAGVIFIAVWSWRSKKPV